MSDKEGVIIDKYGALQEKTMIRKTSLGIVRMPYWIDGQGKVAKVYFKVDPANHALEILSDKKTI